MTPVGLDTPASLRYSSILPGEMFGYLVVESGQPRGPRRASRRLRAVHLNADAAILTISRTHDPSQPLASKAKLHRVSPQPPAASRHNTCVPIRGAVVELGTRNLEIVLIPVAPSDEQKQRYGGGHALAASASPTEQLAQSSGQSQPYVSSADEQLGLHQQYMQQSTSNTSPVAAALASLPSRTYPNGLSLFARNEEERISWACRLRRVAVGSTRAEDYYQIGTAIGEGMNGEVKKACDKLTGETVAVKVIPRLGHEHEDEFLAREVQIALTLDHPNIVRTIDVFVRKLRVYFVMEYVPGGELFDYIAESSCFSEKYAAAIVYDLLSALIYLHERGICHRDVKLENLLCTSDTWPFSVKLADFGFSNVLPPPTAAFGVSDRDATLTSFVGTPYYIAPEMLTSSGHGRPVDLWATGVTLYILLSGKFPFGGATEEEYYARVLSKTAYFPEADWKHISPAAKDLICGLLAKDPDMRLTARQAREHCWFQCRDSALLSHSTLVSDVSPRLPPTSTLADDRAVRLSMRETAVNPPTSMSASEANPLVRPVIDGQSNSATSRVPEAQLANEEMSTPSSSHHVGSEGPHASMPLHSGFSPLGPVPPIQQSAMPEPIEPGRARTQRRTASSTLPIRSYAFLNGETTSRVKSNHTGPTGVHPGSSSRGLGGGAGGGGSSGVNAVNGLRSSRRGAVSAPRRAARWAVRAAATAALRMLDENGSDVESTVYTASDTEAWPSAGARRRAGYRRLAEPVGSRNLRSRNSYGVGYDPQRDSRPLAPIQGQQQQRQQTLRQTHQRQEHREAQNKQFSAQTHKKKQQRQRQSRDQEQENLYMQFQRDQEEYGHFGRGMPAQNEGFVDPALPASRSRGSVGPDSYARLRTQNISRRSGRLSGRLAMPRALTIGFESRGYDPSGSKPFMGLNSKKGGNVKPRDLSGDGPSASPHGNAKRRSGRLPGRFPMRRASTVNVAEHGEAESTRSRIAPLAEGGQTITVQSTTAPSSRTETISSTPSPTPSENVPVEESTAMPRSIEVVRQSRNSGNRSDGEEGVLGPSAKQSVGDNRALASHSARPRATPRTAMAPAVTLDATPRVVPSFRVAAVSGEHLDGSGDDNASGPLNPDRVERVAVAQSHTSHAHMRRDTYSSPRSGSDSNMSSNSRGEFSGMVLAPSQGAKSDSEEHALVWQSKSGRLGRRVPRRLRPRSSTLQFDSDGAYDDRHVRPAPAQLDRRGVDEVHVNSDPGSQRRLGERPGGERKGSMVHSTATGSVASNTGLSGDAATMPSWSAQTAVDKADEATANLRRSTKFDRLRGHLRSFHRSDVTASSNVGGGGGISANAAGSSGRGGADNASAAGSFVGGSSVGGGGSVPGDNSRVFRHGFLSGHERLGVSRKSTAAGGGGSVPSVSDGHNSGSGRKKSILNRLKRPHNKYKGTVSQANDGGIPPKDRLHHNSGAAHDNQGGGTGARGGRVEPLRSSRLGSSALTALRVRASGSLRPGRGDSKPWGHRKASKLSAMISSDLPRSAIPRHRGGMERLGSGFLVRDFGIPEDEAVDLSSRSLPSNESGHTAYDTTRPMFSSTSASGRAWQ